MSNGDASSKKRMTDPPSEGDYSGGAGGVKSRVSVPGSLMALGQEPILKESIQTAEARRRRVSISGSARTSRRNDLESRFQGDLPSAPRRLCASAVGSDVREQVLDRAPLPRLPLSFARER